MEPTNEATAATTPTNPPILIESGMRTGQGDEDNDAESLTIAEKYDDETTAADAATEPTQVYEAAVALGTPPGEVAEVVADVTNEGPNGGT